MCSCGDTPQHALALTDGKEMHTQLSLNRKLPGTGFIYFFGSIFIIAFKLNSVLSSKNVVFQDLSAKSLRL
jgi:hypothetical protein